MSKQSSRWQACLAGAGSILDLSGSRRGLRRLAPAPRRSDAEALAGDFRAIGGDLERALVAYAAQLPPRRRRELARRLAAEAGTGDVRRDSALPVPHGLSVELMRLLDAFATAQPRRDGSAHETHQARERSRTQATPAGGAPGR